ncbi:hypothetical protein LXL04_034773 [Taraxacum kok-saghyz]
MGLKQIATKTKTDYKPVNGGGEGGRRPIKWESDGDGGINPRASLTENGGIDSNNSELDVDSKSSEAENQGAGSRSREIFGADNVKESRGRTRKQEEDLHSRIQPFSALASSRLHASPFHFSLLIQVFNSSTILDLSLKPEAAGCDCDCDSFFPSNSPSRFLHSRKSQLRSRHSPVHATTVASSHSEFMDSNTLRCCLSKDWLFGDASYNVDDTVNKIVDLDTNKEGNNSVKSSTVPLL